MCVEQSLPNLIIPQSEEFQELFALNNWRPVIITSPKRLPKSQGNTLAAVGPSNIKRTGPDQRVAGETESGRSLQCMYGPTVEFEAL